MQSYRSRALVCLLACSFVSIVFTSGVSYLRTDWKRWEVPTSPQMRVSWLADSRKMVSLKIGGNLYQEDSRIICEEYRSIELAGKIQFDETKWRFNPLGYNRRFSFTHRDSKVVDSYNSKWSHLPIAKVRVDILRTSSFSPGYVSVLSTRTDIHKVAGDFVFKCHVNMPAPAGHYMLIATFCPEELAESGSLAEVEEHAEFLFARPLELLKYEQREGEVGQRVKMNF